LPLLAGHGGRGRKPLIRIPAATHIPTESAPGPIARALTAFCTG
jgi:hypothetical protein